MRRLMRYVSVMGLRLFDWLGTYRNLFVLALGLSFSISVYWGAYLIIVALWSWVKDMLGSPSYLLR